MMNFHHAAWILLLVTICGSNSIRSSSPNVDVVHLPIAREEASYRIISSDGLPDLIKQLQNQVQTLQEEQQKDREKILQLQKSVQEFHGDALLGFAETVQMKQHISENRDRIKTLEDETKNVKLEIERINYEQKLALKEHTKYVEYKERAGKRMHLIDKKINKIELFFEIVDETVEEINQNISDINQNITHFVLTQAKLESIVSENLKDIEQFKKNCTCLTTIHTSGHSSILPSVINKAANTPLSTSGIYNIPFLTDFGSGDETDLFGSSPREQEKNNVETGSGDAVLSPDTNGGYFGSRSTDQSGMRTHDLLQYFLHEINKRDQIISLLQEKYSNLSDNVEQVSVRVSSIQLGSFLVNFQQSLLNFTQNVLTLDQWRMASSDIINSTLNNQNQIMKITNMISENSNRIVDQQWKLSNLETLGDQQFNILRMFVIKLNNSVEDLKEQFQEHEKKHPLNSHADRVRHGQRELATILSRLDDMVLQVIHNENRLGNLEVHILNKTLSDCQKASRDREQDIQIQQHETNLRRNAQTILLLNGLVKKLDQGLYKVHAESRNTSRQIRNLGTDVRNLISFVPAVINIKQEIEHFKFHLPTDCQGYYHRGYRESGIFIIHPVNFSSSLQVACDFSDNSGWTIIQQRLDGSLDFKRNWTEYKNGFGSVSGTYWLGNEVIHSLTKNRNYSLHIEMMDVSKQYWYAEYNYFSVKSEEEKYTLNIDGYHGNATDAFSYSNSMAFSTFDRDNDASSTHCGFYYEVGWWYKHCQSCNLNGRYNLGLVWFNSNWKDWIELRTSVMKIKPR
ncbi:hypothetical protein ACJMK2_038804 [Sinanodonta woodiana]|uniref:Fibrinogen C-terminal domain-containing protein n=1 Tax=Sinanodonta woodiana TaxID=1069815 RepID=A0ABD3WBI3_SINWO